MTFEEMGVYSKSDTHEVKYNKIIDFLGYDNVKSVLKAHFSREEIIKALKTDINLNNISLSRWDKASGFVAITTAQTQTYTLRSCYSGNYLSNLCRMKKITGYSLADCVCILKRCATLWANEPDITYNGTNGFKFDIKDVKFDERYDSDKYETTTLYFIAPKEWLGERFPSAVHSEISVEYPMDNPRAEVATTMMSPVRIDEEGNAEDYDWFDITLQPDEIKALIGLANRAYSK